ncbi:hypothetical protein N7468_000565 [Penicillium chermesinum]|uniref:Uncharacterized protein n=1 Tax=Penicillium chermesinum TaxID=63820 RepID=A0A9W9PNJ7_9EURO|nr:uncharacterized protein N7468_000565 [Penicillium chermesinum]KAJ5249114.1 hypothetical protein N7468_000565 [Penicillium chermesinum]KAJ6151214.1 hypothetical protein N7470_007808 [Penicillium chermesinum]
MNLQELPSAAKDIRNEIKAMIPESSSSKSSNFQEEVTQDEAGNKTYKGVVFDEKMARLQEQMGINKKCERHLVYFSKATRLDTSETEGYLIPLSDNVKIAPLSDNAKTGPGGELQGGPYINVRGGYYIHVSNKAILSSGAAILLVVSEG